VLPTVLQRIPYRLWLLAAIVVVFAVSAIHPANPRDFFFEHILTVLLVGFVVIISRRTPLSNTACALVTAFLLLHIIGAHYTYSKVPYDDWSQRLFGGAVSDLFNFERNHFDRLVHLCWGLLLFRPSRELVARFLGLAGFGASLMAITLLATMSGIYEILEWLFTLVMSPEAAETYNGQQGDVFDAQKDEALALSGSLLAATLFHSFSPLPRALTRKSGQG
jgi:putative membrane protein